MELPGGIKNQRKHITCIYISVDKKAVCEPICVSGMSSFALTELIVVVQLHFSSNSERLEVRFDKATCNYTENDDENVATSVNTRAGEWGDKTVKLKEG